MVKSLSEYDIDILDITSLQWSLLILKLMMSRVGMILTNKWDARVPLFHKEGFQPSAVFQSG